VEEHPMTITVTSASSSLRILVPLSRLVDAPLL